MHYCQSSVYTRRYCDTVRVRWRRWSRPQRGHLRASWCRDQLAAASVPVAEQTVAGRARKTHARHSGGDRSVPAVLSLLVQGRVYAVDEDVRAQRGRAYRSRGRPTRWSWEVRRHARSCRRSQPRRIHPAECYQPASFQRSHHGLRQRQGLTSLYRRNVRGGPVTPLFELRGTVPHFSGRKGEEFAVTCCQQRRSWKLNYNKP